MKPSEITNRGLFLSLFSKTIDAIEFSERVLATDDLPAEVRASRDGGDFTPAYWVWLATRFEEESKIPRVRHDEAAIMAHLNADIPDAAKAFEGPVRVGWTSPPCQYFAGVRMSTQELLRAQGFDTVDVSKLKPATQERIRRGIAKYLSAPTPRTPDQEVAVARSTPRGEPNVTPCHYCQGVENFEINAAGRCAACDGTTVHPEGDDPHDDGEGWDGSDCGVCVLVESATSFDGGPVVRELIGSDGSVTPILGPPPPSISAVRFLALWADRSATNEVRVDDAEDRIVRARWQKMGGDSNWTDAFHALWRETDPSGHAAVFAGTFYATAEMMRAEDPEPFCACGRRISDCDQSRAACRGK